MIEGVVNAALEATVILIVIGSSGQPREIEAVVDTGFSEFLTLSPELIAELQLEYSGVDYLVLANGSVENFEVFNATVAWDGQTRHIEAYAVGSTPLIGMRLLHGHSLYVEVVEGGRVVVQGQG